MLVEILKFILLGIIQGFTEPIPVSSSGHLLIVQTLIKGNMDYSTLAILTNFGSFLAILFVFRKDIKEIVVDFINYIKTKNKKYYANFKYFWLVVIGTIPAGFAGLIVYKLGVFEILENNVKFVGATLLITAGFLYLIRNIKGSKDKEITFKDSLMIGLYQIVALIPGISRSGSTLVGGMNQDLKRETAFKFSFMLYFPISLASMVLEVKDLIETNISNYDMLLYSIATIASLVVTYFSIRWFKEVMKKGKLIYFVIYCLILGSLVILFL